MRLKIAGVPEKFEALFLKAEEVVSQFFKTRLEQPEAGTIEIANSRYILIRGASLSVEFFTLVRSFLGKENTAQADAFSSQLLYDLAHTIGKSDAAEFHRKMNLSDPMERISAGPIHFAYSGWASVKFLSETIPTPDENYCTIYEHPYSFEADAWLEKKITAHFPICVMNAGYSAGWTEESFGVNLEAIEISCRATGADACQFMMAPPYKMEGHLKNYLQAHPEKMAGIREKSPFYFFRQGQSPQDNVSQLLNEKGLLSYARQLESTQNNLTTKIQQLESEVQQRKLIQAELSEKERFNERISHTLPQVLIIYDLEKRQLIYTNSNFSEVTGYSQAELMQMSITELRQFMHPEDEEAQQVISQQWLTLNSDEVLTSQYRMKRHDGSWTWFSARDAVFKFDSAINVIQIIRTAQDITQQKELEAQLLQSQKMEVIGRLAGGVAHDFNNLLTSIMGYSSILIDKLEELPELRSYAERIQQTSVVASSLTRQLLGLSRKHISQKQMINLSQLLSKMKFVLQSLVGEKTHLKLDIQPCTEMILADSSQIEQVILNLAVNARDAMTQGGVLSIKTEIEDLPYNAFTPLIGQIREEQYITLIVQDTGIGMPQTVIQHIFDPFFTTKEAHLGTGLGLPTIGSIVEQLNGAISVESHEGKGSTFKVYFPIHHSPQSQPEVISVSAKASSNTSGTILCVENDIEILELIKLLLEELGYSILVANNPVQAIEMAKVHGPKLNLLLSDIIMPQMNGIEMALCIQEFFPDLPVLFITGYSNEASEIKDIPIKKAELLHKPFTPETLTQTINSILKD